VSVPILVWSDDDDAADPTLTGAKFATLSAVGRWPAPDRPLLAGGAALSTTAWRSVVAHNRLDDLVDAALGGHDRSADELHEAFSAATLPAAVRESLSVSVQRLLDEGALGLALRSSAVAEDLAGRSFAGQYVTRLSVSDVEGATAAYRDCLASAWARGTGGYRRRTADPSSTAPDDHAMAVMLQPMVHLGDGWAGAALSDGARGVVIEVVRGLGDRLMSGRADPLRWSVTGDEEPQGALAAAVANWVRRAEARFGHAIEVEFAVRSDESVPVVLQARPYDTAASYPTRADRWTRPTGLVNGVAVGTGTARGVVCRLDDPADLDLLEPSGVLVTSSTDPGWLPLLEQVAAVVTDHGGLTSHAAIVCRELGLLAVVGCGDATLRLAHGDLVEVSCDGATGAVRRLAPND